MKRLFFVCVLCHEESVVEGEVTSYGCSCGNRYLRPVSKLKSVM